MYLECIKLNKFDNTLLKDENYTREICELIPQIRSHAQIREDHESLNLHDKRKFVSTPFFRDMKS